jgi:flavin reductase (DIM6/NTAB) family NADH-FMN oxidoreductase RutF
MASGEELRALMRRFPAGVAVVTVDLDGERLGLTVASLVSLSLDPPLVGVSISQQAALHELLVRVEEFGVNLLGADQAPLAAHFARGVPPIALWHGVPVRAREVGPPLLEDAVGWLDCRRYAEHPMGDHTLFVGEATRVDHGPAERALVYLGQQYVAA